MAWWFLQVLQKSIDYIQYLLQQRRRQEDERNALRKDVVALRIMQANYEQIVKAQHSVPGHNEQRLTDQDKFQVVSIPFVKPPFYSAMCYETKAFAST